MRVMILFALILAASFFGMDYYNLNAGKPAAQRVAVVDYLESWLPGRALPAGPVSAPVSAPVAAPVAVVPAAGVPAAGAPAPGGFMGTVGGLFAKMTGSGKPPPVDLTDPVAVEAAIRSGNVEAIGAAVDAEFSRVAAALDSGAVPPEAAPALPGPERAARKKPGQITIGTGTCGNRAGGGKFCSVGD